jgi:hypothetical protein
MRPVTGTPNHSCYSAWPSARLRVRPQPPGAGEPEPNIGNLPYTLRKACNAAAMRYE